MTVHAGYPGSPASPATRFAIVHGPGGSLTWRTARLRDLGPLPPATKRSNGFGGHRRSAMTQASHNPGDSDCAAIGAAIGAHEALGTLLSSRGRRMPVPVCDALGSAR